MEDELASEATDVGARGIDTPHFQLDRFQSFVVPTSRWVVERLERSTRGTLALQVASREGRGRSGVGATQRARTLVQGEHETTRTNDRPTARILFSFLGALGPPETQTRDRLCSAFGGDESQ